MERKTIVEIFTDMIRDLIQDYNVGENGITEITVSPQVFRLLEEQEFLSKIDRCMYNDYDRFKNPPTQAAICTQMGIITIKKDLTSIIKEKKCRIEALQKEIKDLENQQ